MCCSRSAVFHRLQLGSHTSLLLLQQRCALFDFPRFFFLLGAMEGETRTTWDQAVDDDVFVSGRTERCDGP
jgi:hypothetical protein